MSGTTKAGGTHCTGMLSCSRYVDLDIKHFDDTYNISLQECMEESKRDLAFKVFVILMQPKETLRGCTAYMEKYFRSRMYLNKDDPQLVKKLTHHLKTIKAN